MARSNKVGPPVTGDDFYGRINELARAHELLDSNHSLVLSAPRRIGKSSFAKRLIEDKTRQGWKCVYVDLEGIRTQDEFLRSLITKFTASGIWTDTANAAGSVLSGILESVKGIGAVKFDFSNFKTPENLYQSLAALIDHDRDTLIVIDELTLFLGITERGTGNTDESSFFLNWFRSLRQVDHSRIRWIFCGSVGLHNFTRTRRLSMTINDLMELSFDAMGPEEAAGLVKALAEAEGINMDDSILKAFLDQLNWYIPSFIQLLFITVKQNTPKGENIKLSTIQESFRQIARSESLSTWSERMGEYNGQEKGARFILRLLATSGEGIDRNQLLESYMHTMHSEDELDADMELSDILNMLEHDGYILRTDDGKRKFRSPLLKEWWRYKFLG